MNPSQHEEIYLSLLRVWNHEISQTSLIKIPNKDSFLQQIKRLIQDLKKQMRDAKINEIKIVTQKTIENIRYMINDFLEIRTEKIMKMARCMEKIDQSTLLPIETPYYQSLYTAFTGYSKTKKFTMIDILYNGDSKEFITPDGECLDVAQSGISDIQISSGTNAQDIGILDHSAITDLENSKPEEQYNTIEENNSSQTPTPKQPIVLNERESTSTLEKKKGSDCEPRSNKIDYSAIRALRTIPELVGEDLQIYGPFEKEDIVYLPKKNAVILIQERMAKFVDETPIRSAS